MNLSNLASRADANKVIVDATPLKFGGSWSGSILAQVVTISSVDGTLDGSALFGVGAAAVLA